MTGYPSVHSLFVEHARSAPDGIAILDGAGVVTYGELAGRASALARELGGLGIGPGAIVGIDLPRGVDYAVAVYGVLMSGAACLPVSPDDPVRRTADVLRSAGITALVGPPGAEPGPGVPVVDAGSGARPADDELFTADVPAEAPAFVFSTSGSTGVPKSVVLPHATCAAQIPWTRDVFGLGPGDRHLLKMRVNFVTLLRCLVWPLSTGGSTVLVPEGQEADLGGLARLTAEHGVTVTTFIPSVLRLFLDQTHAPRCDALRHVLVGGEPIPATLQRRFLATYPSAVLHNVYGLSEVPLVSHWRCRADAAGPAPMGFVVEDVVRPVILGPDLAPAGPGEPGELCLSGVGVMPGYLGAPGLNEERFVPDPSGTGTVFRTGDRVRAEPDGRLEFVGRTDDLAKVRGFRVELGDVEAAVDRHPDVDQVAVVLRDGPDGTRRIVAYVVGAAGSEALREHLTRTLPDYMVPSFVVRLEAFPLLPNGKVDRAALPAPEDHLSRGPDRAAPRDALERELVAIWRDVLSIDSIGVDDSFVDDLGGDSLRAVEVANRVEQLVGVELPFDVFAGTSTIAELATACRKHLATLGLADVDPVASGRSARDVPAGDVR